jgi:hypothetical protein
VCSSSAVRPDGSADLVRPWRRLLACVVSLVTREVLDAPSSRLLSVFFWRGVKPVGSSRDCAFFCGPSSSRWAYLFRIICFLQLSETKLPARGASGTRRGRIALGFGFGSHGQTNGEQRIEWINGKQMGRVRTVWLLGS